MQALETMSSKVADPPPRDAPVDSHVLEAALEVRPSVVPPAVQLRVGQTLRTTQEDWVLALELSDVLVRHFHAFIVPRFLPSQMMRGWIEGDSHLLGCWSTPPHFNGDDLKKTFKLSGRAIGEYMTEQINWMLLNPLASQDDCFAYLSAADWQMPHGQ